VHQRARCEKGFRRRRLGPRPPAVLGQTRQILVSVCASLSINTTAQRIRQCQEDEFRCPRDRRPEMSAHFGSILLGGLRLAAIVRSLLRLRAPGVHARDDTCCRHPRTRSIFPCRFQLVSMILLTLVIVPDNFKCPPVPRSPANPILREIAMAETVLDSARSQKQVSASP
jgi:hypothetical protein